MEEFIKILTNQATDIERKSFFKSLEKDSEKREYFLRIFNLWKLSGININSLSREETNKLFNNYWNQVMPQKQKKAVFISILKNVSVFIFALVLGWYINNVFNPDKQHEDPKKYCFQTKTKSVSTYQLSDSSIITLNSNSKINITEYKDSIITKLVGEAYFNVKHNSKRVFMVKVNDIKITDLGTRFNVEAYPSDNIINTFLEEGKININLKNNKIDLEPGDKLSYNKINKKVDIYKNKNKDLTSWISGKFMFIDMSLADICKKLENWYGVTIKIKSNKLKEIKLSAIVRQKESIKNVLDLISNLDNIKYKEIKNNDDKELYIIY